MAEEKNQVAELDLVKFQLLTSYLGMAKQKVQSIADNKRRCEAELELYSYQEKEAGAEVERISAELSGYYNQLRKDYAMEGNDNLNFATGEILRAENHGSREAQKNQKDQSQKNQEG